MTTTGQIKRGNTKNLRPRWVKGQSGNPGGRPKSAEGVRDLARQYGPEAIAKLVTLMRSSKDERMQMDAAEALLHRGYGRPVQGISAPDGPLVNINLNSQGAPNLQGADPADVYRWMVQGIVPLDPAAFRRPPIEAPSPEPDSPGQVVPISTRSDP